MDFVHVAAGPFTMGTNAGAPCELPPHVVWLDVFLIARTPVTNREYAQYLAARTAPPPAFWGKPGFDHPDQPAWGAGECGTLTTGAAIANAIFWATGARVRDVPLTPARVLSVLAQAG